MQFIPIKTFDSYITAHIWLGRLEEEGINCYLKDEYTVTIDPMLANAIGGIKLCVNSLQFERAKDLIIEFENENKQVTKCPQCSSLNVQYITTAKPKNWLMAIISSFFASYAVGIEKAYHCFNCGYEFKEANNNVIIENN